MHICRCRAINRRNDGRALGTGHIARKRAGEICRSRSIPTEIGCNGSGREIAGCIALDDRRGRVRVRRGVGKKLGGVNIRRRRTANCRNDGRTLRTRHATRKRTGEVRGCGRRCCIAAETRRNRSGEEVARSIALHNRRSGVRICCGIGGNFGRMDVRSGRAINSSHYGKRLRAGHIPGQRPRKAGSCAACVCAIVRNVRRNQRAECGLCIRARCSSRINGVGALICLRYRDRAGSGDRRT